MIAAKMELFDLLRLLPLGDWLALAWFFAAWVGYAWFAKRRAETVGSLLETTNRYRRLWMLQTTHRENRVIDGVVVQNLSTSPSFFASTTILIIGGLLAVIGTSERATELVRDIPFVARTPLVVLELKLLLLTGIFVYAFFRFTWSMRQYTFGALLIASMPDRAVFERGEARREDFADRAGRVVGLAAETFNDGLRAYYMAFAALLWFVSPFAFAIGTAGIVFVLYRREFHSDVLAVLRH
jgi:Predicted membrane protein